MTRRHPDSVTYDQPDVYGTHIIAKASLRRLVRRDLYDRGIVNESVRGPGGRPLCRWCWTEVSGRRSSWCSDECVREYRMETDWNLIRHGVEKRDGGICACCGVDTVQRQRAMFTWLLIRHGTDSIAPWRSGADWVQPWQRELADLIWSIVGRSDARKCPWEADHIVARKDGGRDHPDNLRTLCVPCHRMNTAEQAARWAAERRESDTLFA